MFPGKGTKRTFFELRVKAAWEGSLVDDDGGVLGTGDGEMLLGDVDQDNCGAAADGGDAEYPLRFTAAEDGGKHDAKLRAALDGEGRRVVRAAVAAFVAELRARG